GFPGQRQAGDRPLVPRPGLTGSGAQSAGTRDRVGPGGGPGRGNLHRAYRFHAGYAVGGAIRVATARRFHTLMVAIASSRWAISSSDQTFRASSQVWSVTPASPSRVTSSVSAREARSRAVKNDESRHAAPANSSRLDSPLAS